jgi:hypothetical protein
MTLPSSGWVADAPPKIINQRGRRMAESRGPIKRRIVNSIRKDELSARYKKNQ